jgi:hypothetical protein
MFKANALQQVTVNINDTLEKLRQPETIPQEADNVGVTTIEGIEQPS